MLMILLRWRSCRQVGEWRGSGPFEMMKWVERWFQTLFYASPPLGPLVFLLCLFENIFPRRLTETCPCQKYLFQTVLQRKGRSQKEKLVQKNPSWIFSSLHWSSPMLSILVMFVRMVSDIKHAIFSCKLMLHIPISHESIDFLGITIFFFLHFSIMIAVAWPAGVEDGLVGPEGPEIFCSRLEIFVVCTIIIVYLGSTFPQVLSSTMLLYFEQVAWITMSVATDLLTPILDWMSSLMHWM